MRALKLNLPHKLWGLQCETTEDYLGEAVKPCLGDVQWCPETLSLRWSTRPFVVTKCVEHKTGRDHPCPGPAPQHPKWATTGTEPKNFIEALGNLSPALVQLLPCNTLVKGMTL